MQSSTLFIVIAALALVSFYTGRSRAQQARNSARLLALPAHYGYMAAMWSALPAIVLLLAWLAIEPGYLNNRIIASLPASIVDQPGEAVHLYVNNVLLAVGNGGVSDDPAIEAAAGKYLEAKRNSRILLSALVIILSLSGILFAMTRYLIRQHARRRVEAVVRIALMLCSGVAIVTTIGIVLSVLFEALRFFDSVSIIDFVFGTEWSPQTAIRADQVGSSGTFGAVPLFVGSVLISLIAMLIAVPVGLLTAIYLSEYATRKFRSTAKPTLEILAGIPTVVYGFFAALTVAPFIRGLGESVGLSVASESALAAGIVMGVMIIPFVSSLSDDVINAVPQAMRDGSLALGATRSETIKQVIIPAALPGIVGGVLLAASRAIGETMIVVMAAGLSANLTVNPLEAVTTVTVQIVTLLTGDQEFDSPKTLAAFALGLMLFISTLLLNVVALHIVRKYREQYE
ncbi:MAG TPA: phosphate ABC transporter permease subunit PstC [Gammaproteobacteria bacterium]|nr:phosphate ABC transporter permease subunit PstC [Gammaproteobacteria bacterium]